MASPMSGVLAVPAAAALPASARIKSLAPIAGMTAAFFIGYMLVQTIEYGALSIYLPVLKVTRFTTVLSYGLVLSVLMRYKGEVFQSKQAKLFATFVILTGAGILWAVVKSYVPTAFRYQIDYFGLFIISAFIIDRRHRTNVLALAFVAITILLVATNRNMLGQDIRFGAFAAAYFMGDGNDFGWGLIVMLPFSLYLMVGKRRLITRLIGMAGLLVGVVGIIGTESRGATLALIGQMLLFWATVSRRKLLFAGAAAAGVIAVLLLAPPAYFARMNTLQNYEEDNSAQGRLRAWRAARQMALDYPLGVGANNFNSAYGRFYMPADTSGWAANRWISTHSCYFKVLAEYGYPGLILFISILVITLKDNFVSAARIRRAGGAAVFDPEWPLLLNVSLVGYAICAIFLGGITYPHLFLIVGLTVAASRMSARETTLAPATAEGTATATASTRPMAGRSGRLVPATPGPRPSPAAPGRFF